MNIYNYLSNDVIEDLMKEEKGIGEAFPQEMWISLCLASVVRQSKRYKNEQLRISEQGAGFIEISNSSNVYIGTIQIDGNMDNVGYFDDLFRLFPSVESHIRSIEGI